MGLGLGLLVLTQMHTRMQTSLTLPQQNWWQLVPTSACTAGNVHLGRSLQRSPSKRREGAHKRPGRDNKVIGHTSHNPPSLSVHHRPHRTAAKLSPPQPLRRRTHTPQRAQRHSHNHAWDAEINPRQDGCGNSRGRRPCIGTQSRTMTACRARVHLL